VKFGNLKVLRCQFGVFCLSFSQYGQALNIKYEFALQTSNRTSLSLLPLWCGPCWFIDCSTDQFCNFRLCQWDQLCRVCFCQKALPYWAGPMIWWMAKILIRNNTYDARAAGLPNSPVQIASPSRRMSRIIQRNRMLRAYIYWSPPSIEYDL